MLKKILSAIITIAVLASGAFFEKQMNEYRLEESRKTEVSLEIRDGRTVDFDRLKQLNSDAKAWIYLPDTAIDYPVVQGKDNDYYLHRGLDQNYLYEGTIFIDAGNEDPFRDFNTVVYGHHMFSGSMFFTLGKFKDKDYFEKHKVFQLTTEDGEYDLHVVAYCNEDADSKLYSTYFVSDVAGDESAFEDDPDVYTKNGFLDLIRSSAVHMSDEPFNEGDRFVVLSTCAYNFEDARHQVICVMREPALVEKETTKDSSVIFNKWFFAQLAVGMIMFFVIASPLIKSLRKMRKD